MWLLLYQNRGSAFLASLLVGAVIGVIYDVFRVGRVIYSGGRIKLFFEDVLFFIMASLVFTVFMFNATMGVIRMFAAFGALIGFFAYRFSLGLFTVSVTKALKAWLTPYIRKTVGFIKRKIKSCHALCYTRLQSLRISGLAKKGFA